jgi:type I restriction enzyme M protein
MATHQELSNFIWQIADLLRGPYRPPQYERVMLPMTVLRRFDCVLESTKPQVLAKYERFADGKLEADALDSVLNQAAGQRFHNHSRLTFTALKGDPDQIERHLTDYIRSFSSNVRQIFERFDFFTEIERMREANILYLVVSKFCDVDLHPDVVDNPQMGLLFEDLIRRFNEQANETAGDYFTPRDIVELMVDILFTPDDALLRDQTAVRTLFDPTCGTGGLLSEAQRHMDALNPDARLFVYGQDFNPRAYAVAASDMLMKGMEESEIAFGDSLIGDRFPDKRFDYFLANPPFGVDWKRQQKDILREHEKQGHAGRFGAGLPRVNDGSLLFLEHMISKFEPVRTGADAKDGPGGSRLAIVFNGSPLFTGGAGSGESNIRRWIIENDWLEAIIAMPEQMFYNTGIGTYVWILSNRKAPERRKKIQLIDARARWRPMRRSLGDKRREMGRDDISAVAREYGEFRETATSKIFDNADFGYTRVTVERPLRLRFQITLERKAAYLDAVPHLLDDVQAIDAALGRDPLADWNAVLARVQAVLKEHASRWKATELKLFRDVFTDRDPNAASVISKLEPLKPNQELTLADRLNGWFAESAPANDIEPSLLPLQFHPKGTSRVKYEPNSDLRDFENVPLNDADILAHALTPDYGDYENVPLKDEVDVYFCREVLPHVSDAWMDREKDKIGYEINFNRHFFKFMPPRPLEEIDADLKLAEAEIMRLLSEVTS